MSTRLLVVAFANRRRAEHFVASLTRLVDDGALVIDDLVYVHKGKGGVAVITETKDISPLRAATAGAGIGFVLGLVLAAPFAVMAVGAGAAALIAKLRDTGISDEFLHEIRDELDNGRIAVALLISHSDEELVRAELSKHKGGTYIAGDLDDEAAAALQEALDAGG